MVAAGAENEDDVMGEEASLQVLQEVPGGPQGQSAAVNERARHGAWAWSAELFG